MRGGEIEAESRGGDQRNETFAAHGGLHQEEGNIRFLLYPAISRSASGNPAGLPLSRGEFAAKLPIDDPV